MRYGENGDGVNKIHITEEKPHPLFKRTLSNRREYSRKLVILMKNTCNQDQSSVVSF